MHTYKHTCTHSKRHVDAITQAWGAGLLTAIKSSQLSLTEGTSTLPITHTDTHTHTHTHTHTLSHTYLYTYTYTHMHTHTQTHTLGSRSLIPPLCVQSALSLSEVLNVI